VLAEEDAIKDTQVLAEKDVIKESCSIERDRHIEGFEKCARAP
jgi:hypothetical protein